MLRRFSAEDTFCNASLNLLGQLQEEPTALMNAFVINQINPNTERCQGLRKDHLGLDKFPCVEISFEIFKEK